MAIVFDTKAELEAFCEAFELKANLHKPIKKSRKKYNELEKAIDKPQTVIRSVESDELSTVGIAPREAIYFPELVADEPMILASVS